MSKASRAVSVDGNAEQLELDFKQAVIELAESDLAGAIRSLDESLRILVSSPLAHSLDSVRNGLHQLARVHQELADLWLPVNLPRTAACDDFRKLNGGRDEDSLS